MPFIPEGLAEVRFTADEREKLGREYQAWIETVQADRQKLLNETWVKSLENYEGKEGQKSFPWPGASNVVVPMTRTYTNSLASRLHTAATAQGWRRRPRHRQR